MSRTRTVTIAGLIAVLFVTAACHRHFYRHHHRHHGHGHYFGEAGSPANMPALAITGEEQSEG